MQALIDQRAGGFHNHGWGVQRRNAIFRSLLDGFNDSMNNSIRSFAMELHFDDKENSSHLSNVDSSFHNSNPVVIHALPNHPNQVLLQDSTVPLQPLFTTEPRFNPVRPLETFATSGGFLVNDGNRSEEGEERSEVSDYFVGFGQEQHGVNQLTERRVSDLALGEVNSLGPQVNLHTNGNGRSLENETVENAGQNGILSFNQQSRVHPQRNGRLFHDAISNGIQQTSGRSGAFALLLQEHQQGQ